MRLQTLFLFFIAALGLIGFGFGSKYLSYHPKYEEVEGVAIQQMKSFVIILYGLNDGVLCERSLRSIFEQDHQNIRVIFVDDHSQDDTFQKVQNYILAQSQEHRSLLIQNEKRMGRGASIERAAMHCQGDEIILTITAHDWFTEPQVLSHLNQIFQNPKVWAVKGQNIQYPSYEFLEPDEPICFYRFLLKQNIQSIASNAKKHLQCTRKPLLFNFSHPML